ncbi:equilibrative nucleoside transporter 1a isoform X2 [Scleropages formosus]|uniref:equilibrative nucleoside transporter 1a isoform X2 n=1 Tax=Scleropages formosus TaxID=113540 RepID=UPI000878CFD5|nr:equilibrative nucleoside transporter 1-like isoform X2 [Scleropages formosus]
MTAINAPRDRYHAVWIIFFILGLGTLLPWNFFMTATAYFTSRLKNSTNLTASEAVGRNTLESTFNNVMTLCAMVPLLIFTCLNSFIHQKIPQKVRILGGLVAIFVVFLVTAIVVKVEISPLPFYVFTMIKIVFINSFGAILQSSLFGLAGMLPASYTAPIMSGQGLAGTFAAFSMICALLSGSELQDSAFGYFITACMVILLAIVSYIALPKMEFFQYYLETNSNRASGDEENKMDLLKKDPAEKMPVLNDEEPASSSSVFSIFRKIWVMALSVCFVFTITIGVFPAVTVDAQSTVATDRATYFIPVSCFLVFNLMDWAGRSLTALCMWPGKDSILLPILVLVRLIFVPLFMLCNIKPREYLPVVFENDGWYIFFMVLFAFSNGYLASLCMCFGPKKVLPHEAETAGAVMAFFLSLGLALGAALSFAFRAMV